MLGFLAQQCADKGHAKLVAAWLQQSQSSLHLQLAAMVHSGVADAGQAQALLSAMLNDSASAEAGLQLASSMAMHSRRVAGIVADTLAEFIMQPSVTWRTPAAPDVLQLLAHVRRDFLPAHAAALLQRDAAFIYEPKVLLAALEHARAAVLPYLSGAVVIPAAPIAAAEGYAEVALERAQPGDFGKAWLMPAVVASRAKLLPVQHQHALAAHLVRILSAPQSSARTAQELRADALAQLLALPDLPLAALRALIAMDNPQPPLRDAIINALGRHPCLPELMPDLIAALSDGRSSAAITPVMLRLEQLSPAERLPQLQATVAQGARVGAMRKVVQALGTLYAANDAESAQARRSLLALLTKAPSHIDVQLEALAQLAEVDASEPELRAFLLHTIRAVGNDAAQAAADCKLAAACVDAAGTADLVCADSMLEWCISARHACMRTRCMPALKHETRKVKRQCRMLPLRTCRHGAQLVNGASCASAAIAASVLHNPTH